MNDLAPITALSKQEIAEALFAMCREQGWDTIAEAGRRSLPGHHPEMFAEGSWQYVVAKLIEDGLRG